MELFAAGVFVGLVVGLVLAGAWMCKAMRDE
jgi:hypothetical protein